MGGLVRGHMISHTLKYQPFSEDLVGGAVKCAENEYQDEVTVSLKGTTLRSPTGQMTVSLLRRGKNTSIK